MTISSSGTRRRCGTASFLTLIGLAAGSAWLATRGIVTRLRSMERAWLCRSSRDLYSNSSSSGKLQGRFKWA